MATLSSLDAGQAAADSSYEGYSAWSVALHVAYCKWGIADALLSEAGRAELGPYPYPKGRGGFSPPTDAGASAWADFQAYLSGLHRTTMRAIRESDDRVFDLEFAAWKIPMGKAIVWLCGHDSYHNAQIRSMGLASLRGDRAY